LSSWWNEATATAMFTTKPKSVIGYWLCFSFFARGSVTVTRRVSLLQTAGWVPSQLLSAARPNNTAKINLNIEY